MGGLKTIERCVSVGGKPRISMLLPMQKRLLGRNKPIIQRNNLQPLFLLLLLRSLSSPPLPSLLHAAGLCAPPRRVKAITFEVAVNMVPRY